MPKRLYLSPVVTLQREDAQVRTSKIASLLSAGVVTGTVQQLIGPARNWCLVLADVLDHTPLEQDAELHPLPVYPFDGRLSAMERTALQRLETRLQALGVDTSQFKASDGYRLVVRFVGRHLEPAFNEQTYNPG